MKYKTPYKDLLPPLSSEEKAALRASIKDSYVRDAVIINEHNEVLDGHHRLGIDPDAPAQLGPKGMTEAETKAFVFQCNFTRRNLSPEQKQERRETMIAVAKALKEENPKKNTQRQIARQLGVAQSTIAGWLITNIGADKSNKSIPSIDGRIALSPQEEKKVKTRCDSGETQAAVAADLGVSQPTISKVVRQKRKTPERQSKPPSAKERMKVWNDDVEAYAHRAMRILKDAPKGELFDKNKKEIIQSQLKAVATTIRLAKGVKVCGDCKGKGCKECRKVGFLAATITTN